MATKKKEEWTVRWRSDWNEGFTSPRDGWILPRKLEADAERAGVRVSVEIDVEEGKARARRVSVETDNPHGVGWTELAKIQVRNIVGTAVLGSLMKTAAGDEGAVQLLPPERKDSDTVRQIVQGAVGYRPRTLRTEA